MHISPKDTERIKRFYKKSLNTYGIHDVRSVHWADTNNQRVRFNILLALAPLQNTQILDVGCGSGDMYGFIQERHISCSYTGIDIMGEFIDAAQKKYPGQKFMEKDIFDVEESFDYILASGALSFKVEHNDSYYKQIITHMFEHASKGVAFNMLDIHHHINDDTFAAYEPDEIADFCRTFCNNVQIVVDYLPHDFTIYLYK